MASIVHEYEELLHSLKGLQASGFVDIGSFALLIYDYILTFEAERTLVWSQRRSVTNGLFLLTRYLPFVDLSITASHHFRQNMTPEACNLAYKSAGWLINIGICVAEFILWARTWAIWGGFKTRWMTVLLSIWAACAIIPDIIIMEFFMKSIKFTQLPEGINGCLVTSGNTLLVAIWIILMIYEAGILAALLVKGYSYYREHSGTNENSTKLLDSVFKDGSIFYVYIFILSVANVIVISRLSRDLESMLASLERVTHAILTERLVLTLRANAARDEGLGSTHASTNTGIAFAPGQQNSEGTDSETICMSHI